MAEDTNPEHDSTLPPAGKKAAAKSAAKKGVAKRATKKTAAKRSAAKKSGAKKATAKKATTKKSTGKRSTAKRSTAKKSAAKKSGAKKSTAKKSTAKKSAKKSAAKKQAVSKRTPTRPAAASTSSAHPGVPGLDPREVARPWLDSYPPGVPETYAYPDVPLTRLLDDAAQDFPETPATHFLGKEITYRELLDAVDRFATALSSLGIGKGDRVGVILPNCPQHVIAIFGVLRLGAVVAENNPLYTSDELAHQLGDAGVKAVVCLDPIYPRVAEIRGQLPTLEHVISTGIQDALPFPKNKLFPLKGKRDGTYYKIPASEGVLSMMDLIDGAAPTAVQADIDPATDLAFLVYTGGTTGTSKGVMLTHANLVANAFQGRLWMPDVAAGQENILAVMPFFHSYGLTTCLGIGVLSGATLTLLPRFDVDMVLKTIDKQRPTLFPGVPTIYVAINQAAAGKDYDLSSVRACLSGAAPLPVEVATEFEQLTGGKLREGYGLTETAPITHANPIYGKAKKGSIGLPVSDTVCALVDIADHTVAAAPGEPGELAISGPQVMAGYWQRPEETDAVLKDGWLLTGDIAVMDEEGYFSIVDRKKDMIIAGGYNIYPRDIEEALYTHAKVEKACVAGIPDAYRGETVKAFIVLRDGEEATPEEMDAYLRERLAAYKVPKAYQFRESLPETMIGKTLRRELIAEELEAQKRDA